VYAFGGRDNDYNERLLDRPPTTDIRNLMTSFGIALDKHLKLDDHDAEDGDGAAVDRWLAETVGDG